MADKPTPGKQEKQPWLRAISVAGYKSLSAKQRLEIRPLTILAGANSSGKSSVMQPVLLIKQTLEAPYDPGSLLLNGANVQLTSADQLLSKQSESECAQEFSIEFDMEGQKVEVAFSQVPRKGLTVSRTTISGGETELVISEDEDIDFEKAKVPLKKITGIIFPKELSDIGMLKVVRDRSFLTLGFSFEEEGNTFRFFHPGERLTGRIASLIHVPGLRGNPERNYKTTAVGDAFPGTFENYVASVINHWQLNSDERLTQLGVDLERLGLTWKIEAYPRDETQVELKVGRLPHGSQGDTHDLVSIADVGFGVSQTLPVLVALLAAKAGQIVYIEQPEIHLPPRAQRALATSFADAAKRGVIVILETHSALLIKGIQTLVAKDELPQELVKLHWFQRDVSGMTRISSANLDETGAFGDWPEDFDDVELASESEYLCAAEAKLFKQS
ncbi:MAG: AAA family ATPase [Sulfuricellaceae bacterium]